MRQFAILSLYTLLIWSLVRIFSVDDALLDFIMLGVIPLTSIQLNFWATLLLLGASLIPLFRWAQTVGLQLVEFKLAETAKAEIKRKEQELAAAKQENVETITAQLEIDDLDIVSL